MKIGNIQSNFLTVVGENATLEQVNGGHCSYIFSYDIDPSAALHSGAKFVRISISNKKPVVTPSPTIATVNNSTGLVGVNNGTVISNILKQKSLAKDKAKVAEEKMLMSIDSDFTAFISTESASSIAKANGKKIEVSKKREVVNVPISEALEQNLNFSILETPTVLNTDKSSNVSSAIASMNSILLYKQDPASMLVKQNAIASTSKVVNGVVSKATKTFLNPQSELLLKQLNDSGLTVKPTMMNVEQTATIAQIKTVKGTTITVTEAFDIPLELIGMNDFFVIYDAIGEAQKILQRVVVNVAHSKAISNLFVPKIAPSLIVSPVSKAGTVRLEISQLDPIATGVKIYRKAIDFASQRETGYVFVGDMPLSYTEGNKYFIDINPSGKTSIYRAIPYGPSNISSFEFASAVTKTDVKITNKAKKETSNFCSMNYTYTNGGLQIALKDFPIDAVALCLKRRINTPYGKLQKEEVVDRIISLEEDKNNFVTFQDKNVGNDRTYIYNAYCTRRNGDTNQIGELCVIYRPQATNLIETVVTNGKTVITENGIDITFNLTTSIKDTGETQVKAVLESQGLGQLFTDSVSKEKLRELFVYQVVRTDVTTGDISDLGIVMSDTFSDSAASSTTGANALIEGHEYNYKITSLLRKPNTLLSDYTVTVVDEKYANKSYTYKPYKWHHPMVLEKGTIVSDASLKRNHFQNQFSFGYVGGHTEVTFSVPETVPVISIPKAVKLNKNNVKITWDLKGNATKVDHFIVLLELLGIRTVVGKAHALIENNAYYFIDELTNNEAGTLSYVVIPVYNDYSKGKEQKSNGVIV